MVITTRGPVILAFGFWLWSAFILLGAGYIGAVLNCDSDGSGDFCKPGFPSWLEPWTWGHHYVFPETLYVGVPGLGAASLFVAFTIGRRRIPAAAALAVSFVLLSYPFFAGLTPYGRAVFSFGPLLGIAPVVTLFKRRARRNERGTFRGGV